MGHCSPAAPPLGACLPVCIIHWRVLRSRHSSFPSAGYGYDLNIIKNKSFREVHDAFDAYSHVNIVI